MTRLRHFVDLVDKRGNGQELPYLALEHIQSGTGQMVDAALPVRVATESEVVVKPGDVLYGKLRPYLNKVVQPDFETATSTELLSLRARQELESRYLYYLVLSRSFLSFGNSASYGVKMPRTSWELVRQFSLTPLPLPTQRKIADFLDRETERIDALVDKKRRLIDLLEEKRTATITHAVTKGLDPTAPMKDSGIPWIGKIPAHWDIQRLAIVMRQMTNGFVGPTRDILVDQGVRYIQSLHVKEGLINFHTPYFVSPVWSQDHSRTILGVGDILLVQTGDIGQSAVVGTDIAGSNCHALIIMRMRDVQGDPEYFGYALRSHSIREAILETRTGALHPHLNVGSVRDVKVPVPPRGEQSAIAGYLSEHGHAVASAIAAVNAQVILLAEYREALITAAVTGEIDIDEHTKAIRR